MERDLVFVAFHVAQCPPVTKHPDCFAGASVSIVPSGCGNDAYVSHARYGFWTKSERGLRSSMSIGPIVSRYRQSAVVSGTGKFASNAKFRSHLWIVLLLTTANITPLAANTQGGSYRLSRTRRARTSRSARREAQVETTGSPKPAGEATSLPVRARHWLAWA